MKRNAFIPALFIGCALILNGCGNKNYMKTEQSAAIAAKESIATSAHAPESEKNGSPDNQTSENKANQDTLAGSVTSELHTYKEEKASIQYPSVSGLQDEAKKEKINNLLKNNALEILKVYSVNPEKDSLTITAEVISVDRKRITVVYNGLFYGEGAAYPVNLFYTNTVDINLAKNIRLTDYADPKNLAASIRSNDFQFLDASPELKEAILPLLGETSLEAYTKMFQNADFSMVSASSDNAPVFPESFSYEDRGTIIVSIPVPHSLGDFTLIRYTPETK